MDVLIRNARVTDPQSEHHGRVVDVLVTNGTIAHIGAGLPDNDALVVAADDLHLSPGWVDVFADYREPGHENAGTIATGLACAAAGGFTDVLLAPNTLPVVGSKSIIQFVQQRAVGHAISLWPLGSLSREAEGKELAEMLDMYHHGALAFTDGWKPVQSGNLMLKALEYVKAFHGTILQIPIDTGLASGGLMNEGAVSTRLGMAGIPALAETIMVYRDLELLRYTQSRLHITGVSTAASVDMIRRAKAEGLSVTCSVTPYHIALTDEALMAYDSVFKVAPPLRADGDRQALIEGLRDGVIDCIATHHRPQDWDAKTKEFEYAADGMALQELAYPVLWNTLEGHIDSDRLVEALSVIPRDIFGLPQSIIKEGAEAVITLFSPAGHTAVEEGKALSVSRNNPFYDVPMKGNVIGIINQNQIYLNK